VAACGQCGGSVEAAHRFCPWCAAPQRSKFVEFFRAHPLIEGSKALRVSRYFGPGPAERHVRFSVWSGDRAEAAVSLPEDEADRLSRFLAMPGPRPLGGVARLRRQLEQGVDRTRSLFTAPRT
jgi:hypothetical protein